MEGSRIIAESPNAASLDQSRDQSSEITKIAKDGDLFGMVQNKLKLIKNSSRSPTDMNKSKLSMD